MATHQIMSYCRDCKKNTIHLQPATAHVLHLLLAIISFGVWIPVWLLVVASNNSQASCTDCGRARGLFDSGRAPASEETPRPSARSERSGFRVGRMFRRR
jgi:hypothetical protein